MLTLQDQSIEETEEQDLLEALFSKYPEGKRQEGLEKSVSKETISPKGILSLGIVHKKENTERLKPNKFLSKLPFQTADLLSLAAKIDPKDLLLSKMDAAIEASQLFFTRAIFSPDGQLLTADYKPLDVIVEATGKVYGAPPPPKKPANPDALPPINSGLDAGEAEPEFEEEGDEVMLGSEDKPYELGYYLYNIQSAFGTIEYCILLTF